jgi:hypothetical protein
MSNNPEQKKYQQRKNKKDRILERHTRLVCGFNWRIVSDRSKRIWNVDSNRNSVKFLPVNTEWGWEELPQEIIVKCQKLQVQFWQRNASFTWEMRTRINHRSKVREMNNNKTNKQINKQTNKQFNKQTNERTTDKSKQTCEVVIGNLMHIPQ